MSHSGSRASTYFQIWYKAFISHIQPNNLLPLIDRSLVGQGFCIIDVGTKIEILKQI